MAKLPLEGIRVVDISVIWAGPFATMHLADWGAEVIRVESLRHFQVLTRGVTARPDQEQVANPVRTGGLATYCQRDVSFRPWNRFTIFNGNCAYWTHIDTNALCGAFFLFNYSRHLKFLFFDDSIPIHRA